MVTTRTTTRRQPRPTSATHARHRREAAKEGNGIARPGVRDRARAAMRAGEQGRFDEAVLLMETALIKGEADPRSRVLMRKLLVDWYAALERDEDCLRIAREARGDARQSLGEIDELTLMVRNSLLYWMCCTGQGAEAVVQFPDLIRDIEDHVGPTEELAWAARMNSAMPLKAVGDLEGAEAVYRSLIADMERVLPSTDLMLLTARDNLAECLSAIEDYDASTSLYEDILAELRSFTGPEDARVLRVRDEIATNALLQGRDDRARELCTALVGDCRQSLGEMHRETISLRITLLALATEADDGRAMARWAGELLDHLPDEMKPCARELQELRDRYPTR